MAYLFGIAGAAYHTLFNVIPGDRREQARTFIEGVGSQAGIVLGGLHPLPEDAQLLAHAAADPSAAAGDYAMPSRGQRGVVRAT